MVQPAKPPALVAAFEQLHLRLKRLAATITGNWEDAEDTLQDAFLKLWSSKRDIASTDEAAALMGSPYRLTAPVISGAQLGRTIGFPTVNQRFAPLALIPRAGVYQTDCEVSGRHYAGVTDIGTRPTVNGAHEVRCETHLLDFDGDLYGKTVRVAFLRYLREERKFDTVEALREQIARDRETVRRLAGEQG